MVLVRNEIIEDIPFNNLYKKYRKSDGKNKNFHRLRLLLENYPIHVICQRCKLHKATDVHHIGKNHNNDKLDNLTLLCFRCHHRIHGNKIPFQNSIEEINKLKVNY